MKYAKSLLPGVFLILLFFSNVLSQVKSGEKNPENPKDAAQSKSKDSEDAWKFKFFFVCCRRGQPEIPNQPPVVADLKLDKTELTGNVSIETEMPLLIRVITDASDPEADTLIYNYEVSGGKIIGKGAKIWWDLTEVEAGEYTIKVSADDGCGVCGNTITKIVTVK